MGRDLKGRMRMMKKTMILADNDEAYLERLSNYFMEKSPQLELNIFTNIFYLFIINHGMKITL